MTRFTRRVSLAAVAALSLFLWSCDDLAEPTRPGLEPVPMVVRSTSGTRFTVAYESNPTAGSVSATIGSSGGVLILGDHRLWVSQNAVDGPTEFTMVRDLEHPLRVELKATRTTENDVGSQGFAAPVYLGISYHDATVLPTDPTALEVVYFRSDGLVEEIPTSVYTTENRVVAKLSHFSMYGIAWP